MKSSSLAAHASPKRLDALSMREGTSFAAFSCVRREHRRPHRGYARDRVAAAFGTLFLCALFIHFVTEPGPWVARTSAMPFEAVAELLPSIPTRVSPLPVPFSSPLLRPKVEKAVLPQFIIASDQVAANAPPQAAPAPLPASFTGGAQARTDAGCFDATWAREVTDHVQQFFYYPGAARGRHATGLVMVHFIMRRDGSLDTVEVGKSSGAWALDAAATDIVRKAQPLPVIPGRMHLSWIGLQLPIDFGVPGLHLHPTPGDCG